MAWRKPTDTDIMAKLSVAEVEAYSRSADFASDALSNILTMTANLVRGYIRGGGHAMSPSSGTVPEDLISPLADIAVYDLLKRMAKPINKDREAAKRDAITLLNAVKDGSYKCEPYNQDDDIGGGVSPRFVVKPKILD